MQRWKSALLSVMSVAALGLSGIASAATVSVSALADSWNSGSGTALDTGLSFASGQAFTVAVLATDLWNAGDLPRWSNAAGLVADGFATGIDESGEALGTQISKDWGLLADGLGFQAPYGSLVGQIGSGSLFLIGLGGSFVANAAGNLHLFYWDSYTGDNSGAVSAEIASVPLPAAVWLLLSGLAGVAALARRRGGELAVT